MKEFPLRRVKFNNISNSLCQNTILNFFKDCEIDLVILVNLLRNVF